MISHTVTHALADRRCRDLDLFKTHLEIYESWKQIGMFAFFNGTDSFMTYKLFRLLLYVIMCSHIPFYFLHVSTIYCFLLAEPFNQKN